MDRPVVIEEARAAGAAAIVCIGNVRDASAQVRSLTQQFPGFVYHTAGVHPHDAAQYVPSRDQEWIREELAAGAVAVGECGLDYHYDHSPREQQRAAFLDQLALARELQCPVVVHLREAEEDARAMIGEAARAGSVGVLHSYTGGVGLAEEALDAGWYVSLSGIATFKNWQRDDVVRIVPSDRLLVETDAPYLAPVPMRGKRNEPKFIPHILARLASVRGVTPEVLGAQVTENARTFFGLR